MLSASEQRVAKLAVSRYGADQAEVRRVCRAVVKAQEEGRAADLLEALVKRRLLLPDQAEALRVTVECAVPAAAKETHLPLPEDRNLRVLGNYRLLRLLGIGGMSAVYLGYDPATQQKVAIKILSDELAGQQASLDRFSRESRSGLLLDHPNIVRNLTGGQDRTTGVHYLVLEYVDGPSAHTLLDSLGKLSIADALRIVLDVARGLEHLHSRNLIHRDVKPANILIGQNGIAKLTDFGLAKRMHEASHLTGTHQGFGTPHYMPYEQTMNARRADARSDIFALGATLYHLLTGEVPFPGDNAVEILGSKSEGTYPAARILNPLVPEGVEQLLDKMMARNPANRFQSATELIAALEKTGLAAETLTCLELDIGSGAEDSISNSGQPTKPDLHVSELEAAGGPNADGAFWMLRYRDAEGAWRKVRLTTAQVIARIQQGKLPSSAEARDHAQGTFRPLRDFPEFHNHLTKSGAWRRYLWLVLGLGVAALAAGARALTLP